MEQHGRSLTAQPTRHQPAAGTEAPRLFVTPFKLAATCVVTSLHITMRLRETDTEELRHRPKVTQRGLESQSVPQDFRPSYL